MEITETGFSGLKIIQPKIYSDTRGYFFESYKLETFLKQEYHLTCSG
jgi:dTDP-4-dehydrorhamnose 3,5-epimerase